jgi:hypothetical protein
MVMQMSLIKKVFPILIILSIVTVAWIGFSIYFQSIDLDIDPNATNFTKPISPSFDVEGLEKVELKTKESFPVSPDDFLRLNSSD